MGEFSPFFLAIFQQWASLKFGVLIGLLSFYFLLGRQWIEKNGEVSKNLGLGVSFSGFVLKIWGTTHPPLAFFWNFLHFEGS